MIKKTLSVVLPNYNGKLLLEENLPSLYSALDAYQVKSNVIVVDDCSTDDSLDFLKSRHPNIIVLRNPINSGFSVTCNKGIQYANNDLVCVVNTDVTFHPDYFFHSIRYFESSDVFAVKGDIINYAGQRDYVISVDKLTRVYFKRGFLRFKTDSYPKKINHDMEYPGLGCCFIANTSYLQKLGGFDTIFAPYYWEDSDLALRAIEQNYRLIYEPKSIVYHKASTTMETTQPKLKRKIISNRNKFLFCWRHLKGKKRWTQHVLFMLYSLIFRIFILDWKFYYTFVLALQRKAKFRT